MELTEKEMHLLYDLQYMMTHETWETVKLNDKDNVLRTLFDRLEKIVVPELHQVKGGN